MKRLDFSKPVTRQLTPGSNDYTNPTRPSRHVTWTGGKLPGANLRGRSPEGNYRGEITEGVHLLCI